MKTDELKALTDVLLEQLSIGVILKDTEGNITLVNKMAERISISCAIMCWAIMCGLPYGKVKSQRDAGRGEHHAQTRHRFRRMVDDSRNDRLYLNTCAGLMNSEGVAIGMAVLSEDITDKRMLELERATNYQMLEENNAAIRQKYHELLASLESVIRVNKHQAMQSNVLYYSIMTNAMQDNPCTTR